MKSTATSAGLVGCLLLFLASAGVPAPAVAQDIQVNSADPSSAPQGTVNLNVTIRGKGFKRGAVSWFFVTGTNDPGGISVRSTSFVSPTELVANIDIADTALITKFDIKVQNADGRTGKGTELFSVTAKGSDAGGNPLVRSDFGDLSIDGIRSDGNPAFTCDGASYDYIDNEDSCDPNDVDTASRLINLATYFLRVSAGDQIGQPRWMVLDFGTDPDPTCPDLDVQLSSYAGRYPGVVDPPVVEGCIDNVAVRFFSDGAFKTGVQSSAIHLLIDGPDEVKTGRSTRLQWNAKYQLEFVNPLSVAQAADPNTIVVGADLDDFRAELWTLTKTLRKDMLLGTFNMPFQATLTKTSQVFK